MEVRGAKTNDMCGGLVPFKSRRKSQSKMSIIAMGLTMTLASVLLLNIICIAPVRGDHAHVSAESTEPPAAERVCSGDTCPPKNDGTKKQDHRSSDNNKHKAKFESQEGAEDTVLFLSPESLEEFSAHHDVVVVNFCDQNSGKCRLLDAEMRKASRLGGEARYVFVDSVRYPEVAGIYGVDDVPTVRFFVRGR
jgi:hypothetical protein